MSKKNCLRLIGLLVIVPFLFFSSCQKKEDYPITEKPLLYGFLSAIQNQEKLISGSDTLTVINQMGYARFLGDPNIPNVFVDAGIVTLNDSELTKDVNNQYLKIANNLQLDNAIHWKVAGAGILPSFSFNDTIFFPSYIGALPSIVDKNAGLNLLLDTSTVKGADSVRIYIDDGGNNIVQKTFSATAGNIQIMPSDLSVLNTVNNQTAYLGIYPYAGKLKSISNKGFYFIREARRGQSVNIY